MSNDQYASKRDRQGGRPSAANPPVVSSQSSDTSLSAIHANPSGIDRILEKKSTGVSDIRLRPAPQAGISSVIRRAGIVSNATRIELSTNLGIQSKMDLNEDRALSALVKQIINALQGGIDGQSTGSTDKESLMVLLDLYSLREVQLRSSQAECTAEVLKSISTLVDEIIAATNIQDPTALKATVANAGLNRVHKLEFDSIARSINQKRAKNDSHSELSRLREVLANLETTNCRLIRVSEYRRRQLSTLNTWVDVLRSGEI